MKKTHRAPEKKKLTLDKILGTASSEDSAEGNKVYAFPTSCKSCQHCQQSIVPGNRGTR